MAEPDRAMEEGPGACALLWFQRVVWAGIFANIVITLVSIAFTEQVIALLQLDPATPLVWPRFGAFGILLLTGFYIPAGVDPCRSPFATVFTIVCRFAGFFFFAIAGGRYIAFGLFDLTFGAPQAVLLYVASRRTRDASLGRRFGGREFATLLTLVLTTAYLWGVVQFITAPVLTNYASDEDHFKYGSIGNDGASGVPYAVWVAMPDVCAKHLPAGTRGYAGFGFLWEKGRNPALDTPVGFSRARVGVERMAINCAICHTVSARTAADAEPRLYPGAAGNTIDIQGYQRFLSACAADDEAFTAAKLIPVMAAKVKLTLADEILYRVFLIPILREQLKKQGDAYAWSRQRPRWGPGRIDPFNPVKFGMLKLADDGTIGNSDMLAVWNLAARARIRAPAPYHWDGLSTSLHEVAISSALGDGAVAHEFNDASIARIEAYLRDLKPPASPHRPDAAAVTRGKALFAARCGECHDEGGARTLTIIPPGEIGTDPERGFMWTQAAAATYNAYKVGRDWGFSGFRKVDGYIAEPLYGLWLNGPYLHNGSVPTLRDLLKAPAERPRTFTRGLDVVDGTNGGFVAPSCDPVNPPAQGFCYDTALIGNSNAGHLYGTELAPAEKDDLLAYLLTL